MMQDGPQALRDYLATGSEAAFRQLVACYVDLVYTAAVRLVNGDTHLAEDVTQQVFIDLARLARGLAKEVMLGGWLHRHTCFVAANVLRGDRRRRERERQAVEMNAQTDHSDANLAAVAPALDEAINQLPADDRAAIMLRFFEQRDFRAVGESIGSNEEAARKRVSRALDKLRSLLKRRGFEISAASLAATLGTGAVSAAPAGLAVTVSSAALAASVTAATTTTFTLTTLIAMTKLKAGIITAIVAAGVAIPFWMEHRALEMSRQENAAETARNRALSAENEDLHRQLAKLTNRAPVVANNSSEVLKLRGEVSQLRQLTATNTPPTGPSALAGVTANPEMRKMLRDQQKAGLSMVYKGFGKVANLSTNQVTQLNDLLADNVMENVDHIQAILREGKSPEQSSALFTAQEAALQDKVKELLGPEAFAQYQDYTKNLLSTVTADQFKGMLTGDKETKEAQASKLNQLLKQESQAALAAAGLPPDYQLVPTLNFRNFAYATEMEKNLQLLGNIYDRAAAQAGSFLSPAELEKFAEFRTMAINGNRMGLELNRKMMAPGGR